MDTTKRQAKAPFSVVFDPSAKAKDRRDARYAFVDCQWARSAFREKWPDAELVSVDECDDTQRQWFGEQEVTVSEYWYKTKETYTLVLMSDGSSYDEAELTDVQDELAQQGIVVQRRRNAERIKVWQCVVSGAEILEGPTEWAGRFIPLVPVWGEILEIKGKKKFFGAVRFGKDPQRMYNYERSTFIEVLADQPYSPFMAAAESVAGYEGQWNNLKTSRPPVLLYKADPTLPNGGKPSREPTAQFPVALAQAAAISSDDIKAATGIYDASLPNPGHDRWWPGASLVPQRAGVDGQDPRDQGRGGRVGPSIRRAGRRAHRRQRHEGGLQPSPSHLVRRAPGRARLRAVRRAAPRRGGRRRRAVAGAQGAAQGTAGHRSRCRLQWPHPRRERHPS